MKQTLTCYLLLLLCNSSFAQYDFRGIIKYKLSVQGNNSSPSDSMAIVFDSSRVAVILYLPDSNKVNEMLFIDDFMEMKSYKVNNEKHSYEVDTLKTSTGFEFINDNSIGAVNNQLCMRYRANPKTLDNVNVSRAECLASIDYRNSFIKNYSFLGVQPVIVDNRIVFDLTIFRKDGTRPVFTVTSIQRLENVDKYFDLWGFREENN